MRSHQVGNALMAESTAVTGTAAERATSMLDLLRRVVGFDAAWLALTDPLDHRYRSLTSIDLDQQMVLFLSGPVMARDIEVTETNRARPPLSPSDLPYPAEELPTWAECLIPAGIHEALAVGLFAPDGRHVGFLAVLSGDREPPAPAMRRRLRRLAPVLAHGIDPMRSVVTAARLVRNATAGAVVRRDGDCEPLPGLSEDSLLFTRSPLLEAATERIDDAHVYSSFLWPTNGRPAHSGFVRVTVLRAPEDAPPGVTALVLLSPAGDVCGLTPRELEVLGFLVKGCSNDEIARALVLAPRTVAAHLEHILHKLDARTRTIAAVRAERDGLYIPARARARDIEDHGSAGSAFQS